jgi:hypothetical protein
VEDHLGFGSRAQIELLDRPTYHSARLVNADPSDNEQALQVDKPNHPPNKTEKVGRLALITHAIWSLVPHVRQVPPRQ